MTTVAEVELVKSQPKRYEIEISFLGSPEQIPALFSAMAEAQKELGNAHKTQSNPFHKSKYADLASVWDAWQEVGPKNGLSILQFVTDAGEGRQGVNLTTVIAHKDGGGMSSTSYWPAVKNDPQGFGSAITYARRYCMQALCGICPADDDGNEASGKTTGQKTIGPGPDPDVVRFEKAVEKYKADNERLRKILEEATKAGLTELCNKITGYIQLNNVTGESK